MKSITSLFFLVIILSLVFNACGPRPSPTVIPVAPTHTPEAPTPKPVPTGKTIVVTSPTDGDAGTLRQALLDAQSGDTITFDPAVFPPSAPVTIYLNSELPHVTQGNLTIDASDAGVILDGSNILEGEWTCGLVILSDGNTIQGLQIINFSGAGIDLDGAHHNTIGGDRSTGSGPMGQGNLTSGNSDGIGLFGACDNQIAGNLIGTDVTATQAFGNQHPGIFIQNGASHNVIGPGNIIAYNGDCGIDVRDLSSIGNTITQNSIYDNAQSGINLPEGGDAILLPPVIFDHDLEAGTVVGGTCANCTVEVFSDSGEEGGTYEGQAVADRTGAFTFNKGAVLAGPHLTATTTDVDGNTSEFSTPTSGTSRHIGLQEGNSLPKTQLQPKESKELANNHIGGLWDGFSFSQGAMQETIDTEILPLGLKRIRLAINGISWDTVNWDRPELTVDPSDDEVITRIADNGITITYALTFWDKATWPGGKRENRPRFKTEEEIQRYLDFVRFIVRHFKDRIQYFEIWNEPDVVCEETNADVCAQAIEVDDYINLVRRTVPVIRAEHPEAKIVVGSTCNLRFPEPREYLFTILQSDVMSLVDVVCWHSMYGTSPEYDYYREFYYTYPSLVQEIKDVASAHGFDGEYVSDEMVWRTSEIHIPDEPWTYSETVAAKYCGRGIVMHLGMDVSVSMAVTAQLPQYFSTQRHLCTAMAGAEPISLPIEIQSEATNIASYTFALPNGEHLVALWTDGAAVEDDPGVPAILTLPSFSAEMVTGIDVLNGFEQQMVASMEGGNLIIRNLLVKDYPIMFRFTGKTDDTPD